MVRGSHSSWRRQIAGVIGCGNAFVSRFEPSAVFYRRGITLKSQTSHKRFFASFARAKCTTKKISIENGHREFAGRCPNFFTRAKLHDSLPSSLDCTKFRLLRWNSGVVLGNNWQSIWRNSWNIVVSLLCALL